MIAKEGELLMVRARWMSLPGATRTPRAPRPRAVAAAGLAAGMIAAGLGALPPAGAEEIALGDEPYRPAVHFTPEQSQAANAIVTARTNSNKVELPKRVE